MRFIHSLLIAATILLSAVLLATPTQAEMRAIELLWNCEGPIKGPTEASDGSLLFCVGYIAGFFSAIALAKGLPGNPLFCAPKKGVSRDQGIRVFKKWANDHPEDLHQPARLVIMLAYVNAFPCPAPK